MSNKNLVIVISQSIAEQWVRPAGFETGGSVATEELQRKAVAIENRGIAESLANQTGLETVYARQLADVKKADLERAALIVADARMFIGSAKDLPFRIHDAQQYMGPAFVSALRGGAADSADRDLFIRNVPVALIDADRIPFREPTAKYFDFNVMTPQDINNAIKAYQTSPQSPPTDLSGLRKTAASRDQAQQQVQQ